MGLMTVRIRRGVSMYPVFDTPLANTHEIVYNGKFVNRAWLKEEVMEWMIDQGLPDDTMSNQWTLMDDWKSATATFYFADPQIAMLFKLTWS
jgi:hypothetical protein